MARAEKETKGEIVILEVNRSNSHDPNHGRTEGHSLIRRFPRNPCLVKSRSPGTLIGVVQLYMAPLDTSHIHYSDQCPSIYSSVGQLSTGVGPLLDNVPDLLGLQWHMFIYFTYL